MKYVKLFEEYGQYASFQNEFKETTPEEMERIAGGNLPIEFKNIKLKFAGKNYNFGITEDEGLYKVYKWSSIFELDKIGEFKDLEEAKDLVIKEN